MVPLDPCGESTLAFSTMRSPVVGSHWSHDDTVLDRHMFDGKWLENVFVFAFH